MQMLRFLTLLAFSISFTTANGQNSGANSREPEKKRAVHAPARVKAKNFRKPKVTHTQQYEFYERVERVAREKQRILKKLSKAQYSNPRYFGHKRIPKRRQSYEMRYCNECGIRH